MLSAGVQELDVTDRPARVERDRLEHPFEAIEDRVDAIAIEMAGGVIHAHVQTFAGGADDDRERIVGCVAPVRAGELKLGGRRDAVRIGRIVLEDEQRIEQRSGARAGELLQGREAHMMRADQVAPAPPARASARRRAPPMAARAPGAEAC